MDVLQRPVSPVEMERQFTEDLMQLLLHVRCTQIATEVFMQTPLLREGNRDLKPFGRFSHELFSKLKETSHKLSWFIAIVKRIWPTNKALLDQELDPDGHKVNNVAQLTEWVINSKQDLTDHIDLLINSSRRKELLWKCFRAGHTSCADEDSSEEQVQWKFDAWYNAHYYDSTKA